MVLKVSVVLEILVLTICYTSCQNYQGPTQYLGPQQGQGHQQFTQPQHYTNTPPPPQILSHKQALNHDGNFKYLFTAENGLAQGETIAPDGSRSGGYAYVDPTGRKISVKYTAVPVAPHPAPQAYAPQPQQSYNLGGYKQEDDGQYRPELYEKPHQATYQRPAPAPYQQQAYSAPEPQNIQSNTIDDKEYHDPPGKPHSFGSGYVFEFAG